MFIFKLSKKYFKIKRLKFTRLPIEVRVHLTDGSKIKLKNKIIVKGKPHKPITNNVISVTCDSKKNVQKVL